jgi:hypothetical protein
VRVDEPQRMLQVLRDFLDEPAASAQADRVLPDAPAGLGQPRVVDHQTQAQEDG